MTDSKSNVITQPTNLPPRAMPALVEFGFPWFFTVEHVVWQLCSVLLLGMLISPLPTNLTVHSNLGRTTLFHTQSAMCILLFYNCNYVELWGWGESHLLYKVNVTVWSPGPHLTCIHYSYTTYIGLCVFIVVWQLSCVCLVYKGTPLAMTFCT